VRSSSSANHMSSPDNRSCSVSHSSLKSSKRLTWKG
jgi:hypothetical protein